MSGTRHPLALLAVTALVLALPPEAGAQPRYRLTQAGFRVLQARPVGELHGARRLLSAANFGITPPSVPPPSRANATWCRADRA